ncbi:hypothetical protein BDV26DRAFT_269428 [Aspergillus bertholletiae]|uniref:BTB domain-containing protein n=1 Tax=Aspergillus bertholletiae TaxID=1226010 RepID=A0A5N7AY09_9EURO|nr:hypothetical protein BDV26DRAFT_269428 [Aspergillus bertholletiae]
MEYIIDAEGDMILTVAECSGSLHINLHPKGNHLGLNEPLAMGTLILLCCILDLATPAALSLESILETQVVGGEAVRSLARFSSTAQLQPQPQLTLDNTSAGNSGRPVPLAKRVIFKIHVSSKHLTLASPYFRQRLVPATADHRPVEKDVVPACVDDVDALLIMLDIIHGQTRKVPRFVTFHKLFMIAVLVEHYECVEVMEAIAELWTENLKDEIPSVYSEDLVKWIGIAWIFQLDDLFLKTTRTVIRSCTKPISAVDVPIPITLIGRR